MRFSLVSHFANIVKIMIQTNNEHNSQCCHGNNPRRTATSWSRSFHNNVQQPISYLSSQAGIKIALRTATYHKMQHNCSMDNYLEDSTTANWATSILIPTDVCTTSVSHPQPLTLKTQSTPAPPKLRLNFENYFETEASKKRRSKTYVASILTSQLYPNHGGGRAMRGIFVTPH